MKTFSFVFASLATALLLGCSSVSVTTDYDHEANFAALKTFEWMPTSKDVVSANASSTMFQNSLVEKRFRNAVVTQLGAKGLKEDAANPDFFVVYHTGTQEKVNVTNYGYGYGRWGGYGGGAVHAGDDHPGLCRRKDQTAYLAQCGDRCARKQS
jgi:hypothetical protein